MTRLAFVQAYVLARTPKVGEHFDLGAMMRMANMAFDRIATAVGEHEKAVPRVTSPRVLARIDAFVRETETYSLPMGRGGEIRHRVRIGLTTRDDVTREMSLAIPVVMLGRFIRVAEAHEGLEVVVRTKRKT